MRRIYVPTTVTLMDMLSTTNPTTTVTITSILDMVNSFAPAWLQTTDGIDFQYSFRPAQCYFKE
jgi:hypothetical protein